jgi:hypothetical protein
LEEPEEQLEAPEPPEEHPLEEPELEPEEYPLADTVLEPEECPLADTESDMVQERRVDTTPLRESALILGPTQAVITTIPPKWLVRKPMLWLMAIILCMPCMSGRLRLKYL